VFYLITFVAGVIALRSADARFVANLIASGAYVVVTVLLYFVFRPVSGPVSLAAACVSMTGLLAGVLSMLRLAPVTISPLVFFGFYCLMLGYLVFNSGFMPRWLGVLMAFGGLGWLTFGYPPLSRVLAPYNLAPGIFAEGVLTLWLLLGRAGRSTREERLGA
jgi:hypothetical protein